MNVTPLSLPGLLRIQPKAFGDARGYFFESWSSGRYAGHGVPTTFVQDNFARSERGVLRGLHLQNPHGQGKLVSVVLGEVFDVAVDLRIDSPTFGRWAGLHLSDENHEQLWIPPGFAHGYAVLSETAIFHYKCTDVWHPEHELGVAWDDPDIGIPWPIRDPKLSKRDTTWPRLRDVDRTRLPGFAS